MDPKYYVLGTQVPSQAAMALIETLDLCHTFGGVDNVIDYYWTHHNGQFGPHADGSICIIEIVNL